MDKNPKNILGNNTPENVKGVLTSDSFHTYSKLRETKLHFNLKLFALYFVVILLLVISAIIFASTIKTAYFDSSSETEESFDKINTIKSVYQDNDTIKVEPITDELSSLFEIPVGVKIVELDFDNPLFKGLKINDIIVAISGKNIQDISDMDLSAEELEELRENPFITYTIYRNGIYKTITTFYQYD